MSRKYSLVFNSTIYLFMLLNYFINYNQILLNMFLYDLGNFKKSIL